MKRRIKEMEKKVKKFKLSYSDWLEVNVTIQSFL